MFDEKPPSDMETRKPAKTSGAPFNWKSLPVNVLIQYRDEITACLPALSLKETNLEEELLLQFHAVRALQGDVIGDDDVMANQKAQVANTVTSVLNKLVEMQSEVYTQERFKAIEQLVIRHVSMFDDEKAEKFMNEYENILKSQK